MQGYIQAIEQKETSAGTMYDFKIDGRSIGAGKFPPKGFKPNDYVNYEVVERGKYLNLKPGSMSKANPPAGIPAPAQPAAATSSSAAAIANHDAREEAHSRGAATNTAVAWFKILQDADALPIAASMAKNKKADAMYGVLKEFIGQFYTLTTGRPADFVDASDSEVEAIAGDLLAAEGNDNWNE